MIHVFTIFFRKYLFLYLGASFRCFFDLLYFRIKGDKRKLNIKDYYNYNEQPDKELIDGIIGFFVLGCLIAIFVKIARVNVW